MTRILLAFYNIIIIIIIITLKVLSTKLTPNTTMENGGFSFCFQMYINLLSHSPLLEGKNGFPLKGLCNYAKIYMQKYFSDYFPKSHSSLEKEDTRLLKDC